MLDKHGLRAPSTHIGVETLANVDAAVDEARTLGHKYLILADLPAENRTSLDAFRAFADKLNRAGEAARKHDLWIAWHDEADDFKSFGGQMGYDALVAKLDPHLVRLQLDTGNAMVGGRDPLDLMKRYGDRYYTFHIKDAPALKAPHDVELGKGTVDLRGILSRVKHLDDKYVYVEQETYTGTPLEAVQRDYAYLSKLNF
jgi:sugar phosphate isomerase/epimerase